MSLDVGLALSLNLLKELYSVNINLLTGSLTTLLDSLRQYPPGALYQATDRMGYQIDANLNQARDFFIEKIRAILSTGKPPVDANQQEFI